MLICGYHIVLTSHVYINVYLLIWAYYGIILRGCTKFTIQWRQWIDSQWRQCRTLSPFSPMAIAIFDQQLSTDVIVAIPTALFNDGSLSEIPIHIWIRHCWHLRHSLLCFRTLKTWMKLSFVYVGQWCHCRNCCHYHLSPLSHIRETAWCQLDSETHPTMTTVAT